MIGLGDGVEVEVRRAPVRRRLADQQRELVAGGGQLLTQRRDLALVVGQFGLHGGDVEAGAAAELVAFADQVEVGAV